METLKIQPESLLSKTHFMYSISTKLRPKQLFHTCSKLRALCTPSLTLTSITHEQLIQAPPPPTTTKKTVSRSGGTVRVKVSDAAQLKENWLASLSCPLPEKTHESFSIGINGGDTMPRSNVGPELVIGIDPDLSGALAVLKTDDSGCTAQVFDSPHLQVLIGKRLRRRLDTNSIVKLLRSFDAPIGMGNGTHAFLCQLGYCMLRQRVQAVRAEAICMSRWIAVDGINYFRGESLFEHDLHWALLILGTIAYLEQSTPYPQDGKQGWWSGGFGYGLWIGVLVASGFSVVPVPSCTWKNEFELSGKNSNKDDSRRVASTLFPSMSSLLKRKKDHGRAEALLIAAYGKGMKMKSKSLCISQELVP